MSRGFRPGPFRVKHSQKYNLPLCYTEALQYLVVAGDPIRHHIQQEPAKLLEHIIGKRYNL